jgi:membrane protein
MRLTGRDAWELVKDSAREFQSDKAMTLGAALAFYTALSIAPLLLLVIVITGAVFGEQAARGEIANQLNDLIGSEGAEAVQAMLAKSTSPGGGLVSTVVGVLTLLIGATGVFGSLQDALDTVWNVRPGARPSGLWGLVRDRLLSFSMICGMAFLLLVSLVLGAFVSGLSGALERWLPYSSVWIGAANMAVGFLLTALMFAMIFKVLPHARPAWSDVWVGAVLTAALFTAGKYLIGLYLGTAAVGSSFGAAGSFVVLLFWIYYSSLILLFGAEFTQVYALKRGTGPAAAPPAPAFTPLPA